MPKPKVAFVGSGGAAKGIAHLGVLKAMEEMGIAPDIFVGASAGAIAGAFFSQGFGADDMVDWFRPFWRRMDPQPMKGRLFLGLPNAEQRRSPGYLASGFFSIDRFERYLAAKLPTNDFRRLDRTLLVTAADIDGRGRAVFGRGYEEEVPILSIDLAVEAGADVVVISNVYRPHVTRRKRPSLVHRGGAAVARQSLNIILSEKEKRGIDLIHRLYPHVTVLNVSADLGRYPFTTRGAARKLLTRGYREALRLLAGAKQRGVFEVRSNVRAIGKA